MAAEGTRIGTGYVRIQPDFTGFQEKVGKKLNETLGPALERASAKASGRLGKGLDNRSLRSSLQPLLKHFERFGDDAGKQIASKIGSGAKRAEGDMFGLSGAIKEAGKQAKSTTSRAKILANDTFGIAHAARDAGKGYQILRNTTRDWSHEAKAAESVGRRLSKGITSLFSDLRAVGRNLKASAGGFGSFEGLMARANRAFSFFRNILSSIKLPAFVAGVALLAQSLSALTAGAVATASALAPLVGALIALPAAAIAGAQAFGVLKLAMAGIGNAVKAGLAVQVQGGEQAVQTLRQQENAAEALADAHRTLASSQRDAKYAQEDLTKARKEATRQLEDMRIASEESGLSEREGARALREARRELNATLRDPAASGLDVQAAEQAVEQAKFSLQETRADAKRARADYAEAQKKGVEGMPEVVAAKRAEAEANRSVADAERGVAKAVRDNTDAMKQQGSAATALNQKMAELTPSGRKFARFLISLKPQFDALRETAGKGLFPGAEKGARALLGNLGVVKKVIGSTSSALGKLAAKAGAKLGSEAWGRDLASVGEMNTRILTRMGDAGLNVADAFRNIFLSAEPLLEWMSKGTLAFSEWIKTEAQAERQSGGLAKFFGETREAMERVWRILKPLGEGLLNVGKAARPLGNEILGSLGKAAEGWAKWTDSTEGKNTLKSYFVEVKPAIFEIGRLVRDAGKAFLDLGRQKGVATLVRAIRTTLIPALRDGSGAVTGLLSGFIERFGALRRNGVSSFDAFVQVLVEHAGEAGVKLAKALVSAFVNSDIWGKLAVGGWLFAKFGGGKAFESLGSKFGKQFSTAFLLAVLSTELAKQIKQIVEGEKLDQPNSEEFAKFLNEYFNVDTAKITAANRVRISTSLGNLLFNSQTEKVIAVSNKKLQGIVGQIPEQFAVKFQAMSKLQQVLRSKFAPLPAIAAKAGSNLKASLLPKLDDLTQEGQKKAESFRKKVGGQFEGLAITSKKAFENIGFNVSAFLKSLNLPAPKGFNLQKALRSLPELEPVGRQRGGPVPARATGGLASVVPGNSTGDRHVLSLNGAPIAKVESQEGIFVGNRKMMGAAQAANAAVPRFQTGGLVGKVRELRRGGLAEPRLEGEAGPLRELGQAAIHKVFQGAKDFLDKHRPLSGVSGGMTGSGPVEKVFAEVAKKLSRSKIATLALGEAGFAESGMRDLHYGDSTSQGALQLLASTAASTGIDPHDEAAVASAFLLTGYTGKGGANKLAAQGLPAQLVAQGVQGSAFSDGSNYLAQEGAAKGWMRRFGLRGGGLLKRAARGGPIAATVGHFAGGGMVDPSWDPGDETIASSIAQLVGQYAKRFDADITSGYDPSGHVSPGHLITGTATDVVPRDGNWDGAFAKGLETLAGLGFEVGYDGSIPGTQAWPDHGRGNHAHIEWVGNGTAGDARQRLRQYLGAPGAAAGAAPGAQPKEQIPGSYQGAKTAPLDFGPMPKSPEAASKQIAHWQREARTYRRAKGYAEKHDRPEVAQAVGRNLAAIERRVAALTQLRTRLRLQGVKKRLKKRLGGAFKKLAGYEQLIEGAERNYGSAAQFAEQVVGLEPQSPELPATATDRQREAAEADYVKRYSAYVDGPERSAYASVLGSVADWRNTILKAELFGFGDKRPSVARLQTNWEGEDRKATGAIAQIKDFAEKVKERIAAYRKEHSTGDLPKWLKDQIRKREEERSELPGLQLKDSKLKEAIGKAREAFFPGGENRLVPPSLPLPGSGSLEEKLTDVQGIHVFPDEHELLPASALEPPRAPGKFGGVIWDVQTSIEELGLKIRQATSGLGGGSSSSDEGNSEAAARAKELILQANQRTAVSEAQFDVLRQFKESYPVGFPFAGKFHSGGITPGPQGQESLALVRSGERIRTPEQELEMAEAIRGISSSISAEGGSAPVIEHITIHGDGSATVRFEGRDFEQAVRNVVRGAPMTGRITPGGARGR
jgi:hypothetical protein